MRGHYTFENGKFIPQGEMHLINEKLCTMKMLAGSAGLGIGEFFFDPNEGRYWHYTQQENYETDLVPIERSEIEKKFPSVDCEKLLDVKRPQEH